MELVVRSAGAEAEIAVTPEPAAVDGDTLADLLVRCYQRPAPPTVTVDGRAISTARPLASAGLRRGSVVDLDAAPALAAAAVAELVIAAGVGTGRRLALPAGRYRLGTGRAAHDLATGTVADGHLTLDTADREWLARNSLVPVADRVLRIGPPPALPATTVVARPFNRPPRSTPPDPPPPIEVPDQEPRDREARGFLLIAMIAPVPIGAAMALMLGQPRFLLFCLLSPVMVVANWIEEHRARRRRDARRNQEDDAARRRLAAELAARHADETCRRRDAHPDIAELIRRLQTADARLWERRAHDADAWLVPVGLADEPWAPALTRGTLEGVDELIGALGPLRSVPVVADLRRAVGIVGAAPDGDAVVRAIVLAATALHGPADLAVLAVAGRARSAAWEWVKWLPHAHDGHGLATDPQQVREIVAELLDHPRPRRTLVVAAGSEWWHDHDAPLRPLLAHPERAPLVALTNRARLLPAPVATIIEVPRGGAPGAIDQLEERHRRERIVLAQVDEAVARDAARAVAGTTDPEQRDDGRAIPDRVDLLTALGLPEPDGEAIRTRWRRPDRGPRATLGLGRDGPVAVDLVADGPHGLVAGTTGAGKSELLRTLVVGLAAALPPDELNVVLVDFKGGAAFDACAELPHTVGLVTDLDEHLAARVLRCLRAELTRRERWLREIGAVAIDDAPRGLARLLLVIDEFALLATQLPAFLPGLVDLAQRGRSLGIHLILATQRPAGVVDHTIKANTNLRVALRVQDDADSYDVIDTTGAAAISRRRPGRAIVRFGAGELVELQTALATGTTVSTGTALRLRPAVVARALTAVERRLADLAAGRTTGAPIASDLQRLVGAITAAAADCPRPVRPYLDPLPNVLAALPVDTPVDPGLVPGGLADLPDEQRRVAWGWRPTSSLIVFGMAGAGTTSTLLTLLLGAARRAGPDDLHLYVVDGDAGLLAPLARLPHTGAYVRVDEADRLIRLAALLDRTLERRRRRPVDERSPHTVLAVDNLASLRQAIDEDRTLHAVGATVERVARDGPAVGLSLLASATHERAVPLAIGAQIGQRLVMRMADPHAYAAFGLRAADVPEMVPGRGLDPAGRVEVQIVTPPADVDAAVAHVASPWAAPTRPAERVDPIPTDVRIGDLLDRAVRRADGWSIPVGLDRRRGEPAVVHLRAGTTFLVAGPAGSGRTSALLAVAHAARAADPALALYAASPTPSEALAEIADVPLRPDDARAWVDRLLADRRPRLVLVDDADALGGPSFQRLAATPPPAVTWVLSGPADALRAVGHWARPLLRTRRGLLLAPGPTDGDLLRVTLPPRAVGGGKGGGWLALDGELTPVICARPDRAAS